MDSDSLTVCAAAAVSGGRLAAGVVIKQGQATVHAAARVIDERPKRVAAVYRALAYGLQKARQMGARQIQLMTDDEEVIAHLKGEAWVASTLTGAYLQVRALMNAFREVHLAWVARDCNADAVLAAEEALGLLPHFDSSRLLPLWVSASATRGQGHCRSLQPFDTSGEKEPQES